MTSARDEASPTEAAAREATEWFVRLNNPLVSDADRRAFRDWIAADPAHTQAFDEVRDLWKALDGPAAALAAHERRAALPVVASPPRSRLMMAAAFACAVAIAFGVAVWRDPGVATRLLADHATQKGARLEVALSDGSRVLLDGDTAIDEAFTPQSRDVILLRGRAFFDVAPDPARPFRVRAGGVEAQALGTAFSVDREAGQVTVEHGEVGVEAGGAKARLGEGEQATATDGALGSPTRVDPTTTFAWRRGLIVLDAASLEDVFREMERLAPGRVVALQPDVRALRLSGSFRADDRQAMLDAMRHGLGLKTVEVPGLGTLVYR